MTVCLCICEITIFNWVTFLFSKNISNTPEIIECPIFWHNIHYFICWHQPSPMIQGFYLTREPPHWMLFPEKIQTKQGEGSMSRQQFYPRGIDLRYLCLVTPLVSEVLFKTRELFFFSSPEWLESREEKDLPERRWPTTWRYTCVSRQNCRDASQRFCCCLKSARTGLSA